MLLDRAPREIIWLAEPGAGGGGGGGGNQQKEPIKKAELPGKEKLTVPVAKPPEPTPIPEVKPPEEQKINIPAVTLSAENETSPGAIESKEDTTSQGTGTSRRRRHRIRARASAMGRVQGLAKEVGVAPAVASTVPAMASSDRDCCAVFGQITPRKPCARRFRAWSGLRASCCPMAASAT